MTEEYDMVILGGGKAGKTLAMDRAKAGQNVCLVEIGMIGGACINVACIPTKTLVRSAGVTELVRRAAAFGAVTESVSVNMPRIAARTAEVVQGMVDYHLKLFAASGLHLLLGTGRFVEPRVIEVTGHAGSIRRVTAPRIYVNLGTDAAIPAVPGLAKAAPLTHVGALKLDTVPERLLVLGGGYIGMELAQAFRRLGSTVVIIEHGMQLAAREDGDVATAIQRLFAEDGIELALNATPVRVDGRSGESVTVTLENGASFTGSHVLVAAGRTPRTAGVGLEVAGVALDARGFIKVDQYLQTTAPGIWGLGESAGSPMFTHVSMDDYRVVKSGITGGTRSTTGRLIPYCVFIDPEFARVGLSEREAHDAGIAYRLATLPVRMIPRAQTLSEQKGFMKALVGSDGHILGFAMLGAQAGEVMTSVQMAMLGSLDFTALRDGIIAHPTLAEGLNMLFSNLSP
jgi:pyruvate/2-oxoglutarate dehydrogenase complex dihydrolipoamide dehydrogenase (E3) component